MDEPSQAVFTALLRGCTIACETLEDALAIMRADSLLDGGPAFQAADLEQLARVLAHYSCHDAAHLLAHNVARQRAAELVSRSTAPPLGTAAAPSHTGCSAAQPAFYESSPAPAR